MALPAHHPTSCKDHPSCPDPRYLQRGLSFLCVWLLELADHFLACTHSVLPFYLTHCAARAAGAGGCPLTWAPARIDPIHNLHWAKGVSVPFPPSFISWQGSCCYNQKFRRFTEYELSSVLSVDLTVFGYRKARVCHFCIFTFFQISKRS